MGEKMEGNCDIIKYNSLKVSIPKRWRDLIKQKQEEIPPPSLDTPPHISINNKPKLITKIKNNELYWILVKNKQVKPITIDKWEKILNNKFSKKEWKKIFTIP